MSIDGNWNITMQTPMGERKFMLACSAEAGALTGTLAGANGNAIHITDGKADGATLFWKAQLQQPMKITLEFTGTVEGPSMTGKVKFGMFHKGDFQGTRA